MVCCLDFLSNVENEKMSEEWIKTYPYLCQGISEKCLKESVLPHIKEMVESKQNLKKRKKGTEMIGLLAANSKEDTIVSHLKKYIYSCSQDHLWHFRMVIAKNFK
mmetsp:Transcript_5614/g.5120  ORF Transcript_5614/g.5120 Transcript_5614/m.5120 type:complete len:105 (+) Transcript_5614:364-678(+)